MNRTPLTLTAFGCGLAICVATATAHAPFKKPFEEKYVKSSPGSEFKVTFRKAGCNVCHVKGKPKDWLNGYGHELAKHLEGRAEERLKQAKAESRDAYKAENEKLLEELKEAIKKSEKAKMKDGTAYGQLFKDLKLPTEEGARSLNDPVHF
jgi:hypothetical protein